MMYNTVQPMVSSHDSLNFSNCKERVSDDKWLELSTCPSKWKLCFQSCCVDLFEDINTALTLFYTLATCKAFMSCAVHFYLG